MPVRRPSPLSLRPLSSSHRRWFWGLIALGIILIAVGWMVTIRDILSSSAPIIGEAIEENLTKAAHGLQQAGEGAAEGADEFEQMLQEAQAGYEEEKARQDETTTDYE